MNVIINSVCLHKCDPRWSWDTGKVSWRDLVLWYVRRGTGHMKKGAERYELLPGRLFLLDSETRCLFGHDSANPLEVQAVHFNFTGNKAGRPFFAAMLGDLDLADSLFDRIHHYHGAGNGEAAGRCVEFLMDEALLSLNRKTGPGPHQSDIKEIKAMIRKEPGADWNLAAMAERANLSPTHFARLFRAETGQSPVSFLIESRIRLAGQLLLYSSHSVSRIGEMCGYSDVYFFSRQFKKRTGIAPSDYRGRGGA